MKPAGAALLLLLLWADAGAREWRVDAAASRLGFTATWEGMPFETLFRRFAADIRFDPQRPEEARIEVRIEVASVDSASPDRDEGMGDPAWLDYGAYPDAVYLATAVRAAGPGAFIAEGELTLKGVTRPVQVELHWQESAGRARLSAEARVRRNDFGVGEGEWADSDEIGYEVRIFGDLALLDAGRR